MSSLGTYLAAGAALGAASEATGTTAFTPLGEQARAADQAGGGAAPSIDLDLGGEQQGGVSGDVLEQLADAAAQQQSGPGALELAQAMQQQQSGPDALEMMQAMQQQENPALEQLRAAYEDQRTRAEEWREEARRRTENADVDGDGDSEVSLPDWVYSLRDDSSDDDSSDSSGDGDSFDLQDLEGRGPAGIGTIVATTGEVGAAAGDTVEESVGGLTKVGNTYSQAARAIAGKEYSAEDTLAESIHGTEKRRIDWDDYKPSMPDAPDLDLGSDSSNDDPPEGETLVEMTPGATKLPGVEAPDRSDSSDSSSSSDGGDSGISLPEELKEKAQAGGNAGGGLIR